jgi:hypothetical protein
MKQNSPGFFASTILALLSCAAAAPALSVDTPYPTMAPAQQYRIASRADEIALARTAAPPSISRDAKILVLGVHGYETAVPGHNDFVCFVERSWTAGFDDPEFWDPTIRAPNCFNPPAVRTVLPQYLKRTEWALAGATREQLIDKTTAAIASHEFEAAAPGAFSFMLSKSGYLGFQAHGPWLPHVMFFVPYGQVHAWGADAADSPVLGQDGRKIDITTLYIPVRTWSDGSLAPLPGAAHHVAAAH